jgi:hypothetical protein
MATFICTLHTEFNILYFMSKLQTEPKLSRFKVYRHNPNKGNETDVTLRTNSPFSILHVHVRDPVATLQLSQYALISTFSAFSTSDINYKKSKALIKNPKTYNTATTFFYHPAKNRDSSVPFVAGICEQRMVVFLKKLYLPLSIIILMIISSFELTCFFTNLRYILTIC